MTELDDLTAAILDVRWPNGDRLDGLTKRTATMTAEHLSSLGYRRVVVDDAMVERTAKAMSTVVPNSDGVLWTYPEIDGETGDSLGDRPVTLLDAADAALTAALGDDRTEEELEAEFRPIRRTP